MLFLSLFIPEMVPNDVQGELKHLYAAAGELLRHFWSCFPVNTPFLEEKVIITIHDVALCSVVTRCRLTTTFYIAAKQHVCAQTTEGAVAPFRILIAPFKVNSLESILCVR